MLLDIDGTLINDNALHLLAWQRALRRVGRHVDATTILHKLGMGSDKLPADILGPDDRVVVEKARQFHGEEYTDKGLIDHAEPLSGAAALLRVLTATWPAFDLPGLSTVLRDWMDAVGLERVGLIANSFGCQLVTDFVLRYPGRAACLVLAGPTVDPHRHSVVQQAARLLLDATREPARRYLRVITADLWEIGVPRTVRLACVTLRDHIEARLPCVPVPTLVVRGGRDPLVPQDWAEEAAALLPDGRLVVIPGYAHIVHFAAPGAFVAVVRPFLEATESAW